MTTDRVLCPLPLGGRAGERVLGPLPQAHKGTPYRTQGFTYIGLLVLVAIMGAVLAAAGEVWQTAARREKEVELLFIGNQFRQALVLYARHATSGGNGAPKQLADLLQDPRYPEVERYLRRVYRDPMTRSGQGDAQWGLVTGPDGEILGIHSLSEEEPLKQSRFGLADQSFEGKKKYAEWVFTRPLK
jgi:type II secretory pathway pseudopilin PulG